MGGLLKWFVLIGDFLFLVILMWFGLGYLRLG